MPGPSFSCMQHHSHSTEAERDGCDAQTLDAMSLVKMAQVGFTGPAKIHRLYEPGRPERRSGLEVVIFAEEQIVPWELGDGEEE
ncbi:MAG TPA: hypothetical protein VMK66_00300 [Myxococcales bacterium]|nr:hypothetical protein [Myxococcales bacterium]